MMNRRGSTINSNSGIRGVSFNGLAKKWMARIRVCGKLKNLGYFNDQKEAASAYAAANIKYFGGFGGIT